MRGTHFLSCSIQDAIATLVQSTPATEIFILEHEILTDAERGGRIFGEPHTCNAWLRHERAIRRLNAAAHLAGLILYADETTTNTIRGVTYYPIVLALANHSLDHRCTRLHTSRQERGGISPGAEMSQYHQVESGARIVWPHESSRDTPVLEHHSW